MEVAEERKEHENRGDPSSGQAPAEARRQSPWNSAALHRNLWVYTCRLGGDRRVLISPGGDSEDLIFAGFPGIFLAHLVPHARLAIPTPVQVVSAGDAREKLPGSSASSAVGCGALGDASSPASASLSFKEPPCCCFLGGSAGGPRHPFLTSRDPAGNKKSLHRGGPAPGRGRWCGWPGP